MILPGPAGTLQHLSTCECFQCNVNEQILIYMLVSMEPTDRALRPAGMPPARIEEAAT